MSWVPLVVAASSFPFFGAASALSVLYGINVGRSMKILAPLSLFNYLNVCSQHGILVKDGRALDRIKRINTVVFDKTGTLTDEIPTVVAVHSSGRYKEVVLLSWTAAIERTQSHPLAKSIVQEARNRSLELPSIEDEKLAQGRGMQAAIEGRVVHIGSYRYLVDENVQVDATCRDMQEQAQLEGNSVVFIAIDGYVEGMIEVSPSIRPEARDMIRALHTRGITTYIASGDHSAATRRIALELGVDGFYSGLLPDGKSDLIEKLQQEGKHVCFVGDGVNDAIALRKAEVSVSLAGASTIATDSAQFVLVDGCLDRLPKIFELAEDFDKNIESGFKLSSLPCVASLVGVYLFHLSIIPVMALYYSGMLSSVLNTMRPLLEFQHDERRRQVGFKNVVREDHNGDNFGGTKSKLFLKSSKNRNLEKISI
jgi:P-type E1-E2 ATPase